MSIEEGKVYAAMARVCVSSCARKKRLSSTDKKKNNNKKKTEAFVKYSGELG